MISREHIQRVHENRFEMRRTHPSYPQEDDETDELTEKFLRGEISAVNNAGGIRSL